MFAISSGPSKIFRVTKMGAADQSALAEKNQSGQSMYRKGMESRQRLIDATARLLATRSFADLRVADIAREAGASKSNFYLYFENVLDAVLAAVENVSMATPTIMALVGKDWTKASQSEDLLAFIREYINLWRSQAHVLRVRSIMLAEGEPRFINAELNSAMPLLQALIRKVEKKQAGQPLKAGLNPVATAGALLAMLERIAAYGPVQENDMGVSDEMMHASVAEIFSRVLCD